MVRGRKKRSGTEYEHTSLCVDVNRYEVSSDASLNFALRGGRMPFSRSNDLAYEFATTLTIHGVCVSPAKRAGETYHLAVMGNEPHAGVFSTTLEDFQARDDRGLLQYRSYRGEKIPIYEVPSGMARLQRERGANAWNAWFWVQPSLASDMLCLLTQLKPLFVTLHERKAGRDRWIERFSLQTSKPGEE